MRGTRRQLILICFFFLGAQVFAAEYYLKPRVVGGPETLTLGDFLVDISGSSPEVMRTPFHLPIMHPAVISADVFRGILSPLREENYVLVGNKVLFVPDDNSKKNDFYLALLKTLVPHLGDIGAWCEITAENLYGLEPVIPDYHAAFSVQPNGSDSFLVSLHPEKEGSGSTYTLRITVHRYISALTASGNLQRSAVITPAKVRVSYVEAGTVQDPLLTADQLAEGFEAASFIPEGAPLLTSNTVKEKVIRSGSRVTIAVSRGAVRLKMQGIAYESGGKGDTIRVKPLHTGKSLRGTVVSAQEVSVDVY